MPEINCDLVFVKTEESKNFEIKIIFAESCADILSDLAFLLEDLIERSFCNLSHLFKKNCNYSCFISEEGFFIGGFQVDNHLTKKAAIHSTLASQAYKITRCLSNLKVSETDLNGLIWNFEGNEIQSTLDENSSLLFYTNFIKHSKVNYCEKVEQLIFAERELEFLLESFFSLKGFSYFLANVSLDFKNSTLNCLKYNQFGNLITSEKYSPVTLLCESCFDIPAIENLYHEELKYLVGYKNSYFFLNSYICFYAIDKRKTFLKENAFSTNEELSMYVIQQILKSEKRINQEHLYALGVFLSRSGNFRILDLSANTPQIIVPTVIFAEIETYKIPPLVKRSKTFVKDLISEFNDSVLKLAELQGYIYQLSLINKEENLFPVPYNKF